MLTGGAKIGLKLGLNCACPLLGTAIVGGYDFYSSIKDGDPVALGFSILDVSLDIVTCGTYSAAKDPATGGC